MKQLIAFILILFACIGCRDKDGYDGYWYIKNGSSQANIRITQLSDEAPVSVDGGDSICIGQIKGEFAATFDVLYTLIRGKRDDEELTFSIADMQGNALKCWRMSDLGSEPHHLFDAQSWIDYPTYEGLEIYRHTWVYTLTDEDLQKSNDY